MAAIPAFPQATRNRGSYSFEFVAPAGDWRQVSILGSIPEADIDDGRNTFDVMVAVDVGGAWRNLIGFGWKGGYSLLPGATTRQPSGGLTRSPFIQQIGGLAGKTIRVTLNVGRRMKLGFDIEVV